MKTVLIIVLMVCIIFLSLDAIFKICNKYFDSKDSFETILEPMQFIGNHIIEDVKKINFQKYADKLCIN